MRTGPDPHTPVATPTARVWVNGVERAVEQVRVSRSIGGSFSTRIVGGRGHVVATATIDWAEGDLVDGKVRHPWHRPDKWPPAAGDQVFIDMGTEQAGTHRMFTGTITGSDGSAATGHITSEAVDRVKDMNREVSIPALLSSHPPLLESGPFRHWGLTTVFLTDTVLRQCGIYTTAPADPDTIFLATMNGSMYPEVGEVHFAYRAGDDDSAPYWYRTAYGVAPIGPRFIGISQPKAASPSIAWELTLDLSTYGEDQFSNQAGCSVRVLDDGGAGFVVFHRNDGMIELRARRSTGSTSTLVTLPRMSATRVTVRVTFDAPNGSQPVGFFARMRFPDGRETTATAGNIDWTHPNHANIDVIGEEGSVGAIHLKRTPGANAWQALTYERDATLTLADSIVAGLHRLEASPDLLGVNALDMLADQSESILTAMWVDEDGHLQWRDQEVSDASPVVATLTAKNHLFDLPWQYTSQGPWSRVRVEYRHPSITRSRFDNITVHQGNGETLEAGQSRSDVVTVPTDEDWHMVAASGTLLAGNASANPTINRGRSTVMGGYRTDGTTTYWAYGVHGDYLSRNFSTINNRAFLVEHGVNAALPEGWSVVLETLEDYPDLWPRWRGVGLPIIRARGRTVWTDAHVTGDPFGPDHAPEYVHNARFYAQWPFEATELLNLIDPLVTRPDPILGPIPIDPDCRIQLADKIQIDDPDTTGLSVIGTVVAIDTTTSDGNQTQTLSLVVHSATMADPNVGDLDAVWGHTIVQALDYHWSGADVAAFDADPLDTRRTPGTP